MKDVFYGEVILQRSECVEGLGLTKVPSIERCPLLEESFISYAPQFIVYQH